MPEQIAPPRLVPLEPPYPEGVEERLRKWMPPDSGAEPLGLFRTLLLHPELADRMRPLGAGLLGHGRLDPRVRELMIHRTCANCAAEYEWGVHAVFFGPRVGLTERELAGTAAGDPDDPIWSESERAVLRLADELHDTAGVSDATFAALTRHFAAQEILELVVIAGWYHLISFVVGAARLPLEPWAARFPAMRDALPGRSRRADST
jgi:4-carboxymuconolactone decarboxylase